MPSQHCPSTRFHFIVMVIMALAFFSGSAKAQVLLVSAQHGPITQLAQADAEQLYLGRLNALPDGTPIRLHDLPAGSARDQFYLRLIGKNPIQTRAYWSRIVFTGRARPPREVSGPAHLRTILASDPNAIGYIPAESITPDLRVLLSLD